MTAKKTENKSKNKVKKKKNKTPVAKAVNEVYTAVLTGKYQQNAERIATAQSLITLRSIEVRKSDELEMGLYGAYKECRERIIKLLLTTVLNNNLRLIDAQIVMEMLKNEVTMISAWEYEHLDEAEAIIAPLTEDIEIAHSSKTIELFKALGNPSSSSGEGEGDY